MQDDKVNPPNAGSPANGDHEPRLADESELANVLQPHPIAQEPEEPLTLVEESKVGDKKPSIKRFASSIGSHKVEFTRKMNLTGQGATRCRLFHSRVSLDSLDNMEQRINEWIDSDNIDIKHVCQSIATMEGKTPRPNILVTIWY